MDWQFVATFLWAEVVGASVAAVAHL